MKFKVAVDEYNNTHYYANATVLDKLPNINDNYNGSRIINIKEIRPDIDNNDEIFEYNFYKLIVLCNPDMDIEDQFEDYYYIAIAEEI